MTANLFGVPDRKPRKVAKPAPGGVVQHLIGVWAGLFQARFGEKPLVTGKDGAALKRLVAHAGDPAIVERRLAVYLQLDDQYIAGQGYPLSLMLGAWNRLVALDRPEPSRVPDAAKTADYLRGLKGGRT